MRPFFALNCLASVCSALVHAAPAAAAEPGSLPCDAASTLDDGEATSVGTAFELNVLWPFFPGGITEMRLLLPVLNAAREDYRGELVLGTYSDFASRVIRDENDGKVRTLAGKVGSRQFFVHGIHVEASANIGWRNETERPDGASYDALPSVVGACGLSKGVCGAPLRERPRRAWRPHLSQ